VLLPGIVSGCAYAVAVAMWACQAAGDPPTGDHPLVLCVDDDEVNHLVLEGMLQSQSYR